MNDVMSSSFYIELSLNEQINECHVHYHREIELYYITEGECDYFINNSVYPLKTGDIIIVPPNVLHSINYKCSKRSRYLIFCNVDFLPASLKETLRTSPQVISSVSSNFEVKKLLESMLWEYENQDQFSKDMIKSSLSALLISLFRSKKSAQERKNHLIKQGIAYIDANYANQISLSDVANELSVRSEHLSRTFKKHTGFGFNEYLTIYRINTAEKMILENPEKSLTEIAFACGFNDSNYFSTRFKKIVGIPPTQFAKEKST